MHFFSFIITTVLAFLFMVFLNSFIKSDCKYSRTLINFNSQKEIILNPIFETSHQEEVKIEIPTLSLLYFNAIDNLQPINLSEYIKKRIDWDYSEELVFIDRFYRKYYSYLKADVLNGIKKSSKLATHIIAGNEKRCIFLLQCFIKKTTNREIKINYSILSKFDETQDKIIDDYVVESITNGEMGPNPYDILHVRSNKIFILFNRPLHVFTVGLCEKKIKAMEIVIQNLLSLSQDYFTYWCVKNNLPLKDLKLALVSQKLDDDLMLNMFAEEYYTERQTEYELVSEKVGFKLKDVREYKILISMQQFISGRIKYKLVFFV